MARTIDKIRSVGSRMLGALSLRNGVRAGDDEALDSRAVSSRSAIYERFGGWVPPPIATIGTKGLKWISQNILTDGHVLSVLRQRTDQALDGGYTIHPPAGATRLELEATDAIKHAHDSIEVVRTGRSVMHAAYSGFSLHNQIWRLGSGRYSAYRLITEQRSKPWDEYSFLVDKFGRTTKVIHRPDLTALSAKAYDATRFLHLSLGWDNTSPWGDSPIDALAMPCWVKNDLGWKTLAMYVDRLGLPHVRVQYEKDARGKYVTANTADDEQLDKIVEDIHTMTGFWVPKGYVVDLMEAQRNGEGAFSTLKSLANAEITEAILQASPLVAEEGQKGQGSYALGSMQSDRAGMTQRMDRLSLTTAWQKQTINRMVMYNFGPRVRPPQIVFDRSLAEAITQFVTLAQGLDIYAKRGLEIPISFVRQLGSIPSPVNGEPVLATGGDSGDLWDGPDNQTRSLKGERAELTLDRLVRRLEQVGEQALAEAAKETRAAKQSIAPGLPAPVDTALYSGCGCGTPTETLSDSPIARREDLPGRSASLDRIEEAGQETAASALNDLVEEALSAAQVLLEPPDGSAPLPVEAAGFEMGEVEEYQSAIELALTRSAVVASASGTLAWLNARPAGRGARRALSGGLGLRAARLDAADEWASGVRWTLKDVTDAVLDGEDNTEAVVRELERWSVVTSEQFDRELLGKLQARALTVANADIDAIRDIFRTNLLAAIEQGWDFRDFEAAVRDTVAGRGFTSHHLENVFRTNSAKAWSISRNETLTTGRVGNDLWGWEFMDVGDGRTRPSHHDLRGLTVPKDHPARQTYATPLDYNCRCEWLAVWVWDIEDGTATQTPEKDIPSIETGFSRRAA